MGPGYGKQKRREAAGERSIYEEQVRRHLKFLSYAPVVFVSATTGKGIDRLFSTLELVARERRKRIAPAR